MPDRGRRARALIACTVLTASLTGCTSASTAPDRSAESAPPTAAAPVDCHDSIRSGPLPEWTRDGFVDGGASFRHVEGQRGRIVGVVFGYPLASPARASRQNRILWVAHGGATGQLRIEARLEGEGTAVRREAGFGGGQSIIDLTRPVCW